MVLPQAMAWVQYWFRVLSLKFCGKSKKNCGDISPQSPAFCMYASHCMIGVHTRVHAKIRGWLHWKSWLGVRVGLHSDGWEHCWCFEVCWQIAEHCCCKKAQTCSSGRQHKRLSAIKSALEQRAHGKARTSPWQTSPCPSFSLRLKPVLLSDKIP